MESVREMVQLRDALRAASAVPTSTNIDSLQVAVCAAVDMLRTAGWPVEAIIIEVKRIASAIGLRPEHTATESDLLTNTVRWCIEHYYRST